MKDEELMDELNGFFERLTCKRIDELVEKGEITKDREDIVREKLRLDLAEAKASRKLDEVTDNDYIEIGVYMNDFRRELVELYEKTYEKCKKWLDDNQKPYCTKPEDEEDC